MTALIGVAAAPVVSFIVACVWTLLGLRFVPMERADRVDRVGRHAVRGKPRDAEQMRELLSSSPIIVIDTSAINAITDRPGVTWISDGYARRMSR